MAADLGLKGHDTNLKSQAYLDQVHKPVEQPPAEASLKASLNNPDAARLRTALL